MNPIAVYSGNTVLYWSAVIISVGLLAALFMSCAVQLSSRGRLVSVLLFFPLAILFSIPLCRALHWYCHQEQYGSFLAAMTNYSSGSYVLSAAIPGVWLAAWIAAKLDDGDTEKLLDAAAPGIALAVAFIRLSSLFNSSCRSKITVTTGILQHLPLAAGNINSSGATEYRFATFFVHFLLMLLCCLVLLRFFYRRRYVPMKAGRFQGNTIRMFLIFYSATELVLDSTRYDSSFLPINGFVSIVQILAAVCLLLLLIHYSRLSIRANGLRWWHWLLWLLWVAALGLGGFMEYWVQRHGNLYLRCYSVMGLCCLILAVIVYRLYLSCCGRTRRAEEEEDEESEDDDEAPAEA